MTRAWLSMIKLDYVGAFYYHPLFWTVPLIIVFLINHQRLSDRLKKIMPNIIIGSFLLVYFVRLYDCDNMIITIDISEGLLYKIIYKILEVML